jgi:hypothetical protein
MIDEVSGVPKILLTFVILITSKYLIARRNNGDRLYYQKSKFEHKLISQFVHRFAHGRFAHH